MGVGLINRSIDCLVNLSVLTQVVVQLTAEYTDTVCEYAATINWQ